MDLVMEVAAGAAHAAMPAHHLLMIKDIPVGYWVCQVLRERLVCVTCNSSLKMSDECTPGVIFVHINQTEPQHVVQCMHARGGQCCFRKLSKLSALNAAW